MMLLMAVDMKPYCSHDDVNFGRRTSTGSKERCAKLLLDQLQQYGFAFVKGTGISTTTCQDALYQTNQFWNHTTPQIRQSCLPSHRLQRHKRGYSPQNTENFASLIDDIDDDSYNHQLPPPNDLVQKFRMGPPTTSSSATNSSSSLGLQCTPSDESYNNNIWPDSTLWGEENVAQFREAIETYFLQLHVVSLQIVQAICDGLISLLLQEKEEGEFNSNATVISQQKKRKQLLIHAINTLCNSITTTETTTSTSVRSNHESILTCLGYQKGARHHPGKNKKIRPLVAAHTDVGLITVLLFDKGNAAVLQRLSSPHHSSSEQQQHHTKQWVDVALPTENLNISVNDDDPWFVINVGDCLSEICGKILPSTLHRVMPVLIPTNVTTPRNCLAMFVGLDTQTKLSFPSLEDEEMTLKQMTFEEWRKNRVARAMYINSIRRKNK